MIVSPVNVFACVSVRVPAPFLVKANAPLITPEIVRVPEVVATVLSVAKITLPVQKLSPLTFSKDAPEGPSVIYLTITIPAAPLDSEEPPPPLFAVGTPV